MRGLKFILLVLVAIAGLTLGTGVGATAGEDSTAPGKVAGGHVRDIVIQGGAQKHVRMPARVKRLLERAADGGGSVTCPGATTVNTAATQTCTWPTPAGSVVCIQLSSSPTVTQTCNATQTDTTKNNNALIAQIIVSHNSATACDAAPALPGRCQDGKQIVRLRQTNGSFANNAGIAQYIKQVLGPGMPDDDEEEELEMGSTSTTGSATQKQESHQIVHLRQLSVSGKNTAPIFQFLRQRERAANAAVAINQFQNTDDAGLCVRDESDGLPATVIVDPDANMCILLNQASTSGQQFASLTGDYREFQRARNTAGGQQLQGNITPFLGGEDYGLVQNSTGVTNVLTIQNERQVQRAVRTGTLTQSQNGPRKGSGSTQATNLNDTWKGFQSSLQTQTNRPTPDTIGTAQVAPGTQTTFLHYSAVTSGNVNATQTASQNGQQSPPSSCSGTSCNILIVGVNGTFTPECPPGTVFDPGTGTCVPCDSEECFISVASTTTPTPLYATRR